MAEDRIYQTKRSAPSTHGLHAPAEREKLWPSTAEASMETSPVCSSAATSDIKMAIEALNTCQTTQGLPAPTSSLFTQGPFGTPVGMYTTKPGCEKLGFPNPLNRAEDRIYPSTHGLHAPAQEGGLEYFLRTAFLVYRNIEEYEKMIHQGSGSAPPTQGVYAPADDEDVEQERLMDSRMYKQAIQGDLVGFIQNFRSISSKKEQEILSQVSPGNNTCLHIAVSFGHHELAKYIVGLCPDLIKKTNSEGDTALHIAARRNDLSFVKFAMDSCPSGSGASRDVEQAEQSLLRIVNKEGNTVLHEALINRCKQEEVVGILIKADPQVAYYPNKEGKPPLYLVEAIGESEVEEHMNPEAKPAVHGAILGKNKVYRKIEECEKMLHQGSGSAPPTQGVYAPADEDEDVEQERLMDSRMYEQAIQGDRDGFIKILRSISSQEFLSQVSPGNNTCLHIAVSFGHHEFAKYIVGLCPDLIKKRNSKGDTSLHIAARKRDLSFVKFVMDSCPSGIGASRDVEKAESSLLRIVNKEKNTVLHEALINHCKQEEVVEVLIKADPQVSYYLNKEGKSPLYLAAESHYFHVVDAIEKSEVEERMENRDRKAKPAVHGAILGKNKEMLEKILALKIVHQRDEHGRTPLHYAASIGYLEGVQTLLARDQSNFDRYHRDDEGFLPIHVASMRGYVDIVKELLQGSYDPIELLSKHGENILHVAAKYGKDNVVNFVLKKKGVENLINEKDRGGNTPLHLATMHAHPKVVNYLTWDKRVDVNLVNNEGQTALDIVVSVEHPTSFHQRLIWTALKSTGARPARNSKVPPKPSKSPNTDKFKDRVNTLLLVSTLVATVTFAAGFTMPGGYNSSDPNAGMAIFLMRNMFQMFVICNTIAMYTSILAAIILIWAQLGDLNLMDTAFRFALPLLGLALYAMSFGFMAGVSLVVSNLHWLAIVVFIIGIICLVSLSVPFFLFFLPSKSTNRILRYISYYPILLLVWASESPGIKQED